MNRRDPAPQACITIEKLGAIEENRRCHTVCYDGEITNSWKALDESHTPKTIIPIQKRTIIGRAANFGSERVRNTTVLNTDKDMTVIHNAIALLPNCNINAIWMSTTRLFRMSCIDLTLRGTGRPLHDGSGAYPPRFHYAPNGANKVANEKTNEVKAKGARDEAAFLGVGHLATISGNCNDEKHVEEGEQRDDHRKYCCKRDDLDMQVKMGVSAKLKAEDARWH